MGKEKSPRSRPIIYIIISFLIDGAVIEIAFAHNVCDPIGPHDIGNAEKKKAIPV